MVMFEPCWGSDIKRKMSPLLVLYLLFFSPKVSTPLFLQGNNNLNGMYSIIKTLVNLHLKGISMQTQEGGVALFGNFHSQVLLTSLGLHHYVHIALIFLFFFSPFFYVTIVPDPCLKSYEYRCAVFQLSIGSRLSHGA